MKFFKSTLKSAFLMGALAIGAIGFTSCGDDEPEVINGCTDELGDNYNADATTDDGSCTYFDRFVGTWTGTFDCDGSLALLFTSADIVVAKGVGANEVSVTVMSSRLPAPVPLTGTITRDQLTVTTFLPTVPLDIIPTIDGEAFSIAVDGTLTLNADGTEVSGDLDFELVELTQNGMIPDVSDTCTYTATK